MKSRLQWPPPCSPQTLKSSMNRDLRQAGRDTQHSHLPEQPAHAHPQHQTELGTQVLMPAQAGPPGSLLRTLALPSWEGEDPAVPLGGTAGSQGATSLALSMRGSRLRRTSAHGLGGQAEATSQQDTANGLGKHQASSLAALQGPRGRARSPDGSEPAELSTLQGQPSPSGWPKGVLLSGEAWTS